MYQTKRVVNEGCRVMIFIQTPSEIDKLTLFAGTKRMLLGGLVALQVFGRAI